jgi:pantothenate kinase type III
METEVSAEVVSSQVDLAALPWAQEIMDQAQALTGTGVDAGTAILAAIGVPVVLKVLQMASPFVETRAKDVQGKIYVAEVEQLGALHEKLGADRFAAAVDAVERQAAASTALRAAGIKAKK